MMDKYKIINQAMKDLVWYTKEELSELVKFKISQHSINALKRRLLIRQNGEKYQTTQADLFTKTTETICTGNNGKAGRSVENTFN